MHMYSAATMAMSRRVALGGVGAMGLMGLGAAPSERMDAPMNFDDPRDNLEAFGKLWFTLGDEPVFSGYEGVQFAIVGKKRAKPLFGYTGFGNMQARILDNGHLRVRGKETSFYTDLATGEILESWFNPFTEENVTPLNMLNDRLRGELGLTMPKFAMSLNEDEATTMSEAVISEGEEEPPFVLPWRRVGHQYLMSWEYGHEYTNPVTPEGWPKASTGKMINPSEHFVVYTPTAEMDDRSRPWVTVLGGFFRQGPWWPWMMMGGSVDGVLIGRMHSYRITGTVDDIPDKVLAYTEKVRPDLLEPADDWDDGSPRETWHAYADRIPPENPLYNERDK